MAADAVSSTAARLYSRCAAHTVCWIYGTVQGGLVAGVLLLPRAGRIASTACLGLVAILALWSGIRRFRPAPALAWWLILAGLAVTVVSSLGLMISMGVVRMPAIMITSDVLRIVRFGLLAAGLVLLGRRAGGPRSDLADMLDAGVAAAGMFLLLWSVVIEPDLTDGGYQPRAMLILTPALALVAFAMVAKVIFSGAVRSLAVGVLVVGVLLTLASPITVLVVDGGGPMWIPRLLNTAGVVLIGATGLLPSLHRVEPAPARPDDGLSGRRVLLFAGLALLGPYAWLVEIWDGVVINEDPVSYMVPVTAAAVLVLLLTARLAMIARLAEQRATVLTRQATELNASIREQDALQRQLAYRALHDPLTGLANRVVLAERMEQALNRRALCALVLLDLDGFKGINDTYGHPTGDEVLVEVARRLVDGASDGAILARLGGDEFAVFVEGAEADEIHAWAEETRLAIQRPIQAAGHELFLTVSIGLFRTSGHERATPSTALRDADLALYAAKDGGRNRAVDFQPHLRRSRNDRTLMSTGLRQALIDNEFSLRYQPIVDLSNDRTVAVEALLRWTRPDGKRVSPATFIPIAEEIGVINMVGRWVLRNACADAAPWYWRHGIAVSVNVSGRQLDDAAFTDQVLDALARANLPGAALILELTETTLVSLSSTALAINQLSHLRGQGVRVAVDDFGTGYSSLSYLSRLPVDIIKLDRSFAQNPGSGGGLGSWAFVRAILQLVDSLGLETVAEGIESRDQADILRQLNCPLAQGYVFSRPVESAVMGRALEMARPHTPATPAAPATRKR